MTSPRASALLVCGLLSFALPRTPCAAAGTDAPATGSTLPDQEIVVAARRLQPAVEAIGTVSGLERRDIERLQAQDLHDLVRYEPAVTVTSDPARFGIDGFNIRGMEGNRVAIEIDGVPQAAGFSVGRLSSAGRDLLEPELIQRFEVLRGPASTLYGSDALAGIVTVATPNPRDLARPGLPYLAARLSHTSRDQATRGSALGAWQGERFGVLGFVAERQGHETENNPEGRAPDANPADTDKQSALFKGTIELPLATVMLSFEHTRNEQATEILSARLASGQFAATEDLQTDDGDERNRLVLNISSEKVPVIADLLELNLYYQRMATDEAVFERRRATPPAVRFPAVRHRSFTLDTELLGMTLLAHRAFDTSGLVHELVYGLSLKHTHVEELRGGTEQNLRTGTIRPVILGENLPVRDFPNSTVNEQGWFAADEMGLFGSRWTFVPGLRYDRYRLDGDTDPIFRADNPKLKIIDVSDDSLSLKLGLRYALSKADGLYVAYTEGFRAAPFMDANIALVLPQFNYVVKPNPDLKPERSRGVEGGWTHASAWSTWRLAGFVNDYRDLIESRVNLGRDATGATVFQSVNRARALIYGAEASFARDLSPLHAALRGVTVRGGFAWTYGQDTERDLPLNSIQPARFILDLSRQASARLPELALTTTLVAPKERVDRSTAKLYSPPGFVTVDARARQALGRHVTLDVGLYNLLDKAYVEWATLRGITATNLPAPAFFSAPGRNVAVTLSIAW